MKTLVLILIVIVIVSGFGWTEEPTVNSLLKITELLARYNDKDISFTDIGLNNITKVGVLVSLVEGETGFFTKQDLENQLLVGLRSKIPRLEITQSWGGEEMQYYVILAIWIMAIKSKALNNFGYAAFVTLSVNRISIIPGPTDKSKPILAFATLWKNENLLTASDTAKSYFNDAIDTLITSLAADYYRQNARQETNKMSPSDDITGAIDYMERLLCNTRLLVITTKSYELNVRKSMQNLKYSKFGFEKESAIAMLETMMRSPISELILEELNNQGLAALMEALNDKDPLVRKRSIQALGKIGNKQVIPTLKKVSKQDSDISVRQLAAEVLGNFDE